MNSRIYFKIGTIFAWKEYKWYEKLKYWFTFRSVPYNRFYVVCRRAVPYFKHVAVYAPIDTLSKEEKDKIRTYFTGKGYLDTDELLINMQYINDNITEINPSRWKNYKLRMKW